MAKNIYEYYKNRLNTIGGDSKCLCFSGTKNTLSCDIGKILTGRDEKIEEFISFLGSNRKTSFTLVSKKDRKALLDRLEQQEKIDSFPAVANDEEAKKIAKRNASLHKEEIRRELDEELTLLKSMKRECEEIEKEIGRNELFVAYPFVFGTFCRADRITPIKAPLLLFPVRIVISGDETVSLVHDTSEKVLINPALITAYSYAKKINTDMLNRDFSTLESFNSLETVINYLKDNKIDIDFSSSKNIFAYSRFKEPAGKNEFSVRYAAILSRFSLSDPICEDYALLEHRRDTSPALDALTSDTGASQTILTKALGLFGKLSKTEKVQTDTYCISSLDYSQLAAVRKVGEEGSIAIHTPPGTDCARVCADIIADTLCKKKRVLLVSNKKNALDTIFSATSTLRDKCIYINDESNEKAAFYNKCLSAHTKGISSPLIDYETLEATHREISTEIMEEDGRIREYFNLLAEVRPFGISLSEMYNSSTNIIGHPAELELYAHLIKNNSIMSLDWHTLKDVMDKICNSDIAKKYYDYVTEKDSNPLFGFILPGVETKVVNEISLLMKRLGEENADGFNSAKYPYFRQVMAYYNELEDKSALDSAVRHESRVKHPKKLFTSKIRGEIKEEFLDTHAAIQAFAKDYEPLRRVFNEAGFLEILNNLLMGRPDYHEFVSSALVKYEKHRELDELFKTVDKRIVTVLQFAYSKSRDRRHYNDIPEKILPLRIYYELIRYEDTLKAELAKAPNLSESREKVLRLDERARKIATQMSNFSQINEYSALYMQEKDKEAYLCEISKSENYLPIKRFVDTYERLVLSLFPCWLLTPENVSTLLPLKKNLFDVVIFDGASQMFVEEAIPSLYRAKTVVVMGDGMQIHPSAAFMRRALGRDDVGCIQEADSFKAESLYDIATKRLPLSNLTYHYGSERGEFIDFSNRAFYSSKLTVAPKTHKKQRLRPIEMHTVDGKSKDGANLEEAKKIIDILSAMSEKRRDCGSIGILTFTKEQQELITSLIEEESRASEQFDSFIKRSKERREGGEDTAFFVKTVENAQGEKRDNIILSPAFAKDESGELKLHTPCEFELETLVNVAITRAKNKFIFVTSILPENIECDSEIGSLATYKKFLSYIKASAIGPKSEVRALLSEINSDSENDKDSTVSVSRYNAAFEMKEKLERMGYTIKLHPGGELSRISLAVYDEKKDRYLVGVIVDGDAFGASESAIEREVYYPKYLEHMGWTIVRITSRDWWVHQKKALTTVIEAAEYNRSDIKNT